MNLRGCWISLAALAALWSRRPIPPRPPLAAGTGVFCDTQHAKECQASVTLREVLDRFKKGNERFASGHGTHCDYAQQVRATAAGISFLATVVSCIDSRLLNSVHQGSAICSMPALPATSSTGTSSAA
jgi:hypothetical protein